MAQPPALPEAILSRPLSALLRHPGSGPKVLSVDYQRRHDWPRSYTAREVELLRRNREINSRRKSSAGSPPGVHAGPKGNTRMGD